jgi:hypothetical protein
MHMLNLKVLFLVFAFISFNVQADYEDTKLNQEQYIPPVMPEYPRTYVDVMTTLAPYYKSERPIDYFFEIYVISTINKLPEETEFALEEFNSKHPSFFESTNGDWKAYVKKQLHLSSTIEVAIWDLWIRNSVSANDSGWKYHPWHYAQNFLDEYSAEGSKVDIWEGNSLELAKNRILEFRESSN